MSLAGALTTTGATTRRGHRHREGSATASQESDAQVRPYRSSTGRSRPTFSALTATKTAGQLVSSSQSNGHEPANKNITMTSERLQQTNRPGLTHFTPARSRQTSSGSTDTSSFTSRGQQTTADMTYSSSMGAHPASIDISIRPEPSRQMSNTSWGPSSLGAAGGFLDDDELSRSLSQHRQSEELARSYNANIRQTEELSRSLSRQQQLQQERDRFLNTNFSPPPSSMHERLSGPTSTNLSNMSPFTRDGVTLAVAGFTYPNAPRSTLTAGLGAVGSGRRRRGDTLTGFRGNALDEHEENEHYVNGNKSGASSRRHSVSAFGNGFTVADPAANGRSQHGFFSSEQEEDLTRGRSGYARLPAAGSNFFGGRGGPTISDDDLASDLNSLQLSLEDQAAQQRRREGQTAYSVRHGAHSLPGYSSHGYLPASPPFSSSPSKPSETSRSPPTESASRSTSLSHSQMRSPLGLEKELSDNLSNLASPHYAAKISPSSRYANLRSAPGYAEQQDVLSTFNAPVPISFSQAAAMRPYSSATTSPNYGQPVPLPYTSSRQPSSAQHQQQMSSLQQQQAYHHTSQLNMASSLGLGGAMALPHDPDYSDLGKGVPLHSVPPNSLLYIVEFKAGRTDLFFLVPSSNQPPVKKGELVIVEADRGRDLGRCVQTEISLADVQAFQKNQVEQALGQLASAQVPGVSAMSPDSQPNPNTIARMTKELHPKKMFGVATAADIQQLGQKAQDEAKALVVVRAKVGQKALPMTVKDCEWQFDRRRLTIYFVSDRRVDFRDLIRELFRLYKTRIWMCSITDPIMTPISVQ
ncbi:uncharacterized protein L969DRAFT_76663 [Mixia osmundae IAM 14324]|uniref:PSP1 C-terminal domain-containing protein n=1 Tax=Mixia osmundae (strain CBS 9802 / IAM 14324 / JCM 22182 / KY 12970) TaxID=764103 RepID=G7E7R6_MIXOS|nr:uncharacterized protein L969DRAFT_76663 [Mixia osmundae IAM 14324]KEI38476.1 hypothetical protein L969DRAFT_76663 [Mixia osmundae IAM 14324]GAA98876.1 hypothetical protein E5Q_05564 [Mixia osmundae IAM 14324]